MPRTRPKLACRQPAAACNAAARVLRMPALVCASLALAACTGPQSTLQPQGPVAETLASMWWVLFFGAAVILALVMGLVFYAMFRDPEKRPVLPHIPFLIGAGLVFPTVVLTALLIYSTDIGRRITAPAESPLHIEVTGHQWWWEVRYPAADGSPEVLTANELRLPVGVPVELSIGSADVIHSFWIPSLAGKVDMIPGRINVLRLSASAPGLLRGQCAEFCGAQHARMGFVAIVEPEADFEAWRQARAAAPDASGPGLDRFMELGCGDCHSIAGTPARGSGGPVLSHFGDRPSVGAGTSANTPEALRAWLEDHGATIKPGSRGPQMRELGAEDVETLATFLEQLR